MRNLRTIGTLSGLIVCAVTAQAQIDPDKRELIEFGYSQAVEGESPLSAYAYYYYNQPSFLQNTNLTLRFVFAPTYIDTELGVAHLITPNTDVGFGMAGGGFADNYYEVDKGKYYKEASFDGHSITPSVNIYHLFNPEQQIPLNGLLRGEYHYADYVRDDTANNFVLPQDMSSFNVRAGFRFGGKEPVLVPDVALELSAWYEGQFRTSSGAYGFNNDRTVEPNTHNFFGRALFAYTLPDSKQNFLVNITTGISAETDRFSAYRLGGTLPLAGEFPLTIPGYFYQELSATRFALFNGNYTVPLDAQKRFSLNLVASAAVMSYLPGLEQDGSWNTGVGGGLSYHSTTDAWRVVLDYGYGFEAIRDHGRGAQSIGLFVQINLEHAQNPYYTPSVNNSVLRGVDSVFHSFY